MYSLKTQLSKSLLVNMIVIMLVMLAGLNVMMLQLLENYVVTRLQHDAESLASVLQRNPAGEWEVQSAHMSTVYNRVRSGHYYRVSVDGANIRSRSLFDLEIAALPSVSEDVLSYEMEGPGNEQWLVWRQTIRKNDSSIDLWVAEDIAPLRAGFYRLSAYALAALMFLTLLSLLAQQYIVDRVFRVFDRLRSHLKTLRQQGTDMPANDMPREIKPLLNEIDLLLDHLGQRTRRTRKAIANLSHELKRPLQVLSLEVDQFAGAGGARQAVSDIHAIIERELRRARLSGSDRVGGEFHIGEEIPYLVDMMKRIYPAVVIEADVRGQRDSIAFDRDDMLELLGNLLDNACKFSRGRVRLVVTSLAHQLTLCFEDDGLGVGTAGMQQLTQPGFRLDESVQGHGLGLSICADIVHSFGGGMAFAKSSWGGLRVAVHLPLTPAGK